MESTDTAGASVLVVEDNAVNQLLIERQLRRLGHRPSIVGTAGAALDALVVREQAFDVVLMDWQLPDLDGLEATRRLRRAEEGTGRHIPIVAVTASAMDQDRNACFAAGMDDFLAKPVVLAELRGVIERWASP